MIDNFDTIDTSILINKLIKKNEINDDSFVIYNKEDVDELESFCKKHGIVGCNFKNMDPKAALRLLKAKVGFREDVITKKTLLKG